MMIGIVTLLLALIVISVLFFLVSRRKIADSETLYPKLTTMLQSKSNWTRKQIPEFDISIAFPKEFSFSKNEGNGEEYLLGMDLGRTIKMKLSKNGPAENEPGWVSACKVQLPGPTKDPELHQVKCGENKYLIQTPNQLLYAQIESKPNDSAENQQQIRSLFEEIMGTIVINSW